MAEKINCLLTKISSNHNNVRTKEAYGYCLKEPELGKRFEMFGEPLEDKEASFRYIHTTPIQKLSKKENAPNKQIIYEVETLNSVYRIEVFPE